MRRIGRFRIVLLAVLLSVPAWAQTPTAVPTEKSPIDFQSIIERAKEKVYPALVYVKPIREDFSMGEKQKEEVFGSGVIISPGGLVITNNHVAEKAVQINCVLYDKRQIRAETVGLDPETDLALLRLLPEGENRNFPYVEFGDSDQITEGQFVMTLGSPFGFTRSISLGIVSNTQQYIGFDTLYQYNNWIQTDAAINPGNSGGPLVDTEGKVIGINTLGISEGENIGFSIPSNVVREISKRLQTDGRVVRTWTGIRIQALKDFYSNTFTEAERGVLISDVENGSPAKDAGIMPGDILVSVSGTPIDGEFVEGLPKIRWLLSDLPAEASAEFTLERGDATIVLPVVPRIKPKIEGEDFECKRWNMTLKEISKFKDPNLYFRVKKGVYVQGVRYPGNAATSGLDSYDIVLAIDREEILTLEDVKRVYDKIIADTGREKKVLIEVLRNGYRDWVVLDYRKNYEEAD